MKTNKILAKRLNPTQILGEKKMSTAIKYDDFMIDFVEKIKTQDMDAFSESLIAAFNSGELEQVQGNLYKHKDFHILELFERHGIDYSNKIKNSNKSFREKFSEFWANLKSKFSKKGGLMIMWKKFKKNF